MTKYKKPLPGEKISGTVNSAGLWAQIIRMVNDYSQGKLGQNRDRSGMQVQPIGINDPSGSGDPLVRYQIARIGYLNNPAGIPQINQAPEVAWNRPLYKLEPLQWHDSIDSVVPITNTIEPGNLQSIRGQRFAVLLINSSQLHNCKPNDRYAMIDPEAPGQMVTCDAGIYEILGDYTAPNGDFWAMVDTQSKQNLWRYELLEDSKAPARTSIKLLRLDGDVFYDSTNPTNPTIPPTPGPTTYLSDPDSLMVDQVTGDKGWCLHITNDFYAIQAPCEQS